MSEENLTIQKQSVEEQQVSEQSIIEEQTESAPRRGRPKIAVSWPSKPFTFSTLLNENVLSSSSLRKKMRASLLSGELVKVDTLRTAFGRPKDIYQKV
jgi:hypothetical protein